MLCMNIQERSLRTNDFCGTACLSAKCRWNFLASPTAVDFHTSRRRQSFSPIWSWDKYHKQKEIDRALFLAIVGNLSHFYLHIHCQSFFRIGRNPRRWHEFYRILWRRPKAKQSAFENGFSSSLPKYTKIYIYILALPFFVFPFWQG